MKTTRRRSNGSEAFVACALVLLALFVSRPADVSAQWTTPDANQNINNTNTGNIGIGTTNPIPKVDIVTGVGNGTVNEPNSFRLRHTATDGNTMTFQFGVNNTPGGGANQGYGYLQANYWGGTFNSILLNPQGGNVGIGVSRANNTLEVRGTAFVAPTNNSVGSEAGWDIGAGGYSAPMASVRGIFDQAAFSSGMGLKFSTSSGADVAYGPVVERMRITGTGNVGIGTTAPGFKFDVQGGQLNASGGLCIAGDCKTAWSQVGGGAVTSVFGRSGAVVAAANDYSFSQLSGSVNLATQVTGVLPVLQGGTQWTTSGSNVHYNSGNVGIGAGVTAPTEALMVNGKISVNRGPSPGAAELRIYNGGSVAEWAFRQASSTNHNLNISKAVSGVYSDYLTVDTAGNVGVGTSTPAAKLHVAGANGPTNNTAAPAPDAFQATGGIGGNGTWGASPGGVGGAINLIGGTGGAPVAGYSTALGGKGGSINLTAGSGGPNVFNVGGGKGGDVLINGGPGVANSDGNTILANLRGSVGIGLEAPAFKLDVNGEINATGLRINGAPIATGSSQWETGPSNISFNSGSVGIGTASPQRLLQLHSTANTVLQVTNSVTGSASTDGFQVIQAGITSYLENQEAGSMIFRTSATDRMAINSSGNVGIGTTAPAVKLSVGGGGANIYATDIWVDNNIHIQGNETLTQGGRGRLRIGTAWGHVGLYTDASSTSANNDLILGSGSGTVRVGPGGAITQNFIVPNGSLGVGTPSPTATLHVVGNGKVTGSLTVDGNIAAKYQDVAEWVESSQNLPPGTVVVLDHTKSNQVVASTRAYDTRVAGVISAQPGIVLGESGEGKVMVATTGRVKIKVDATCAPIQVGDLLVTGDREGFAIKSLPVNIGGVHLHRPGTLVGKALEPLAKGTGEILVLLSLQ
jgi:hypothetical protein